MGHRILEVNGISLLGSSHLDAVKALRSSPERISITVCQGYDLKDLMKKVEAEAAANGRAERSMYYNEIAGRFDLVLCCLRVQFHCRLLVLWLWMMLSTDYSVKAWTASIFLRSPSLPLPQLG